MESENNATLIDTLSLIFARAAELGALAPPILDLHMRTLRANSRLLRSLSRGHAGPPPPNCISVPPRLNLCDVSTANL